MHVAMLGFLDTASQEGAWPASCIFPHCAQELFETPYFCQDQKQELFELARPFEGNPVLQRFADLAKELQVCDRGILLPEL